MRQLPLLILICSILLNGCDNSTVTNEEGHSIPLPPETTTWVSNSSLDLDAWPRFARLALSNLRDIVPESAIEYVSFWEEGIYAVVSEKSVAKIQASASVEESYLDFKVAKWNKEAVSFFATPIADRYLITDNLAALERLIDLVIAGELEFFNVPDSKTAKVFYHRAETDIDWTSDFAGLAPNGYLIALDQGLATGTVKLEKSLRQTDAQLTDLLSRLPSESTDFSITSRVLPGNFGSYTACVRLPQGVALMTRYLGVEKLTKATSSYLNIEMWQSPIDQLGIDVKSDFIYWYCLIDGYLWEAKQKEVIQYIIRHSTGGGINLLEQEEVIAALKAEPMPDFFGSYFTRLGGIIPKQRIIISAKKEKGQVFLYPATGKKSIDWEHDFGSEVTYFYADATTGNWLVQCENGYVYRGKENRVVRLLNADPLIGRPYFGTDGSLIFQNQYEVYREKDSVLDTLVLEAAAPMLHLFEPMEEGSRHYFPAADGRLLGFNGKLDTLESWKTTPTTSRLFGPPVLLQSQEGEVVLVHAAEKGILGFAKSGRLKFALSPDTLLSSLGNCFYVSSIDPYLPNFYRPKEVLDHALLKLGKDSLLRVNADGTFNKYCPRPGEEIDDVLVVYDDGHQRTNYFLLYGETIHAFYPENGDELTRLWQHELTEADGEFVRLEGSDDWGVFLPKNEVFSGFTQGDPLENWSVNASVAPARDAASGNLLVVQGTVVMSKREGL